jgi:hypothetical protein
MRTQKCLSVITMLLLLAESLQAAGVVPGKWAKVDALAAGTPIEIKLKSGDKIVCAFRGSEAQALVVSDLQGSEQRLRKEDVARITGTEAYNDSVANGLGIGFGFGAALGLLGGLVCYQEGEPGAIIPLAAVLYGAMGMGIGALVDYSIKGHEVLYEAAPKAK